MRRDENVTHVQRLKLNLPTLFFKCGQAIFDVHGAWYSPNMAPNMVHAQTPYYNPTTPNQDVSSYPSPGDTLSTFVVLIPGNLPQYTSGLENKQRESACAKVKPQKFEGDKF